LFLNNDCILHSSVVLFLGRSTSITIIPVASREISDDVKSCQPIFFPNLCSDFILKDVANQY
jgi:hypothetical protein